MKSYWDRPNTISDEHESRQNLASLNAAMLSTSPPMNMRDEQPYEMLSRTPASVEKFDFNSKVSAKQMWRLGIPCYTNTPKKIMETIYQILLAHQMEWKVVTPYNLHCRTCAEEKRLKITVQLFKVTNGPYIVDFKRLEGETCPFMELCQSLRRTFETEVLDEDSKFLLSDD